MPTRCVPTGCDPFLQFGQCVSVISAMAHRRIAVRDRASMLCGTPHENRTIAQGSVSRFRLLQMLTNRIVQWVEVRADPVARSPFVLIVFTTFFFLLTFKIAANKLLWN